MKIAFITAWKDPQHSTSGAARISYEIANAFLKYTDHQILFISPDDSTKMFDDENGMKHLHVESVGDESFMYPNLDKSNIKVLYEKLEEFGPDLFHSHTETFLAANIQYWAQKQRIPFISTIHFTPTDMSDFQVGSKTTKVLYKFVDGIKFAESTVKSYLNNCDVVIALNNYIKEDLVKFGYTNAIEVIPNGRDLEGFNNLELNIVDPQKDINLFFVGEINERKNQTYLIEVLKYLPKNYILNLIGISKDKSYQNEINTLVKKYNLENQVVFLGKINFSELPKVISKMHICVSAAKLEVQSLAILESLASGKPIVGLENHTTNELIIEKNRVGYKLPVKVDPKVFSESIVQISNDKKLYKEFSINCKKLSKRFSWKNIVIETESTYLKLMNKYNRPQKTQIKPIYQNLNPELNKKQVNLLKNIFFTWTAFFGTSVVFAAWNSWRNLFKKK